MVSRLILILTLVAFSGKIIAQSFSDETTSGVWDGTINPLFLPLKVEPENNYSSNKLFPGMNRANTSTKELGAGFASNAFKDLFAKFQNEKERIAFGFRLFNLDYYSNVKNSKYDYSLDSSSYEFKSKKNKNYSVSVDGYLNVKQNYQTGISVSAGITRDSMTQKEGIEVIDTSKSLYNNYINVKYSKSISYYVEGAILQRMKRCRKNTFLMLSGGLNNSINNYDYSYGNSTDNTRFKDKYIYAYSIKPGILRFRDEKRLTGLFIGTEYHESNVKDNGSDSLNQYMLKLGLMKDELYRIRYNKRKFFLEGIYSRKINFNNVAFYFGHNILASFGISGLDSLNVKHNDSSFILLNYTMPLLFQFNIKNIVTLHSAYNLKLLFEYLSKVDIDGIEQKLEDYQKTPECDFQFATTPIALTVNIKDRLQFSFVPSFNYSGVFVYKGELRYLF